MHGRKRSTVPPSAEAVAAVRTKLEAYKRMASVALAQRAAHAAGADTLELNGRLACANPDMYTLWNHRREILLAGEAGEGGDEARSSSVGRELTVSAGAIGKNPKSYPPWYHRRWVVQHCHVDVIEAGGKGAVDVEGELALCAKLLAADERNFHCWNYRAWLSAAAHVPDARELAFTGECIAKNFSNYSAWHRRSHLLPRVHGVPDEDGGAPMLPLVVLAGELTQLRQAVFTEPDDQSPWVYRRWVVEQAWRWVAHGRAGADACGAVRLLLDDVASLRELVGMEAGAKWPRIALAHALGLLASPACSALAVKGAFEAAGVPLSTEERVGIDGAWSAGQCYADLAAMDGRHARYYEHEGRKVDSRRTVG
jgi:geranylgeranyl transferase type-2 subunit alpha